MVYISAAVLNGSAVSHLVFTGSLDELNDNDGADGGGGGCDDVAVVAFFFDFTFL